MFKKLLKNCDDYSLMNRKSLFMVSRVFILLLKDIFCIPKNYLDKEVYFMLDEYNFYYDLSKEWKYRKD